jgi:hypothetical protein
MAAAALGTDDRLAALRDTLGSPAAPPPPGQGHGAWRWWPLTTGQGAVGWPRRPRRSPGRAPSLQSPRARAPERANPIGRWWSTPAARRTAGSSPGRAAGTPETDWCVLLPKGPTAGAMAPRAGDVLRAYQAQHGIEPNSGFVPDPLIGNRFLLKPPARMEARGRVVWLARRRWRLGERTLRVPGETTGPPLLGGTKRPRRSQRPSGG